MAVTVAMAGRVLVGVGSRIAVAGVGVIAGCVVDIDVGVAVGNSNVPPACGVTVGNKINGASLVVMGCVVVIGVVVASPAISSMADSVGSGVEVLKGAMMGAGGGVMGSRDERAWVGVTQTVNQANVSNRMMNRSVKLPNNTRCNIMMECSIRMGRNQASGDG